MFDRKHADLLHADFSRQLLNEANCHYTRFIIYTNANIPSVPLTPDATLHRVYCRNSSSFSPDSSSMKRMASAVAATTSRLASSISSERKGRHSGRRIRYSSPT
jgi:hypothetical protein